jgi:hypothetical protein
VIGAPEISTDGLHYYKPAIRDAFGSRAVHGVVQKTYSVTHLNVNEASRRYSPAQVIAVEYDVVSGVPSQISTSYVERQTSRCAWAQNGSLGSATVLAKRSTATWPP